MSRADLSTVTGGVGPEGKTPMRIAMLSIHSSPLGPLGRHDTGGMSVYVRELARELGQQGHRVDIFTRRVNGEAAAILPLAENVRLVHLEGGAWGEVTKPELYPFLPAFLRSMEGFRRAGPVAYDLVHSHYWLSGGLGARAQRLWGVPHVVTFHTLGAVKNQAHPSEGEPPLRIEAERRLVQSSDRILVAAERERENLVGWYGASPGKVAVVPCGVDLGLFQPLPRGAARVRLGLGRGTPLLLYVGRFTPLKGIDALLEALALVRRDLPARLEIVGGDGEGAPATRALRQLAAHLGVADAVHFAGRIDQEELPPYYSAADVLVVPSRYESFGLVALESLACGTPVVATPVGAMEQVLAEEENGVVVADTSPRALADGILGQLSLPVSARPSPAAVRESVLDHDWSRVAEAVAEEYRSLVRETAGSATERRPPGLVAAS